MKLPRIEKIEMPKPEKDRISWNDIPYEEEKKYDWEITRRGREGMSCWDFRICKKSGVKAYTAGFYL